jgi:hypothetical protein
MISSCGVDSSYSEHRSVVGFYEEGNKSRGFRKSLGIFISSWVNVSFSRSLSHGVFRCLLIAVCKNVRPTLSRRTGSDCEERRPYLRCCILIFLNFIFPTLKISYGAWLCPRRYIKLDHSCDILSSHSAVQFTAQYQIIGWCSCVVGLFVQKTR